MSFNSKYKLLVYLFIKIFLTSSVFIFALIWIIYSVIDLENANQFIFNNVADNWSLYDIFNSEIINKVVIVIKVNYTFNVIMIFSFISLFLYIIVIYLDNEQSYWLLSSIIPLIFLLITLDFIIYDNDSRNIFNINNYINPKSSWWFRSIYISLAVKLLYEMLLTFIMSNKRKIYYYNDSWISVSFYRKKVMLLFICLFFLIFININKVYQQGLLDDLISLEKYSILLIDLYDANIKFYWIYVVENVIFIVLMISSILSMIQNILEYNNAYVWWVYRIWYIILSLLTSSITIVKITYYMSTNWSDSVTYLILYSTILINIILINQCVLSWKINEDKYSQCQLKEILLLRKYHNYHVRKKELHVILKWK